MFCHKCGKEIDQDSKFCLFCGQKLADSFTGGASDKKSPEFPKGKLHEISREDSSLGVISKLKLEGDPKNYLAAIIKAKSRKRLVIGYIFLALGLVLVMSQWNYVANIISGPRSVRPEVLEQELTDGNSPRDLNIELDLNADDTQSSGYTQITKTINSQTNAVENMSTDNEYYITLIGKHLLVLESQPGIKPIGKFTGALKPIDPELQTNIINDFNSETKGSNGSRVLLPYVLSDGGIYLLDNIWFILIGLLCFVYGGYKFLKYKSDPLGKKEYVYKIIKDAQYAGIESLSEDFVKSFEGGVITAGSYKITNKFIFKENKFSFEIYPLSQLYWIYKKVTRHSINFIPTGKSYTAVLNFNLNRKIEIKGTEEKVHQYLLMLHSFCPWAELGYNKDKAK